MTQSNRSAFKLSPERQAAWAEAEAALVRFAATRDNQDRERAVTKLYMLGLQEAPDIIRHKAKVDAKLPPDQRRDPEAMAADAVASVLFHKRKRDGASGLTVLSQAYDPERADLRQLVTRALYYKVMDYVRKTPIEGVVGAAPQVSTTLGSLAALTGPSTLASVISTLAPKAPAGAPTVPDSVLDQAADEFTLTTEFKRLLPADDPALAQVFECEFHGLTNEDGVAFLNQTHPPRTNPDGSIKPYISLSSYKRKLALARSILAEVYTGGDP